MLLPAWNAAATVGAAVRSALDQGASVGRVVLVDDGSTDGTADAARHAAAGDPRLVVLERPHRGLVAALNDGLQACEAPYIARLDADDVALPGRVDAQLRALRADPRLAAVDGLVELVGGPPEGMRLWAEWINGLAAPGAIDRELLVESPLVHPGTTLRRAALDAVGGYRHGDFPEDYDLWLRLHAAGWALAKLPLPVVRMTDHPARLTRTDPRYGHAGFRAVRQAWLAATHLQTPRRVAVCGNGREGKLWHRWLRAQGHAIPALLDVNARWIGRERWGTPVRGWTELPQLDADLLLVAVGARGARGDVRRTIAALRPEWQEGEAWFAVR